MNLHKESEQHDTASITLDNIDSLAGWCRDFKKNGWQIQSIEPTEKRGNVKATFTKPNTNQIPAEFEGSDANPSIK